MRDGGKGGGGCVLESAVLTPCLAWWELRSRSAWRAIAMGSWPSYSLDMAGDVLLYNLGVVQCLVADL